MNKKRIVHGIMLYIEKQLDRAKVFVGPEESKDLEEIRYILETLINKYTYEKH